MLVPWLSVTQLSAWPTRDTATLGAAFDTLPQGSTSRIIIHGETWFRNVAANPNIDIDELIAGIKNTFKPAD